MASGKQLVLALFLLGSFGCEYTAEADRPETRVMQSFGACPEEDTVAEEENGVDADRTAWRKIEQAPRRCASAYEYTRRPFSCGGGHGMFAP